MSYSQPATPPELNAELVKEVAKLKPGQMVVELGSGYTTKLIVDNLPSWAKFISIEHSAEWYQDILLKDEHMSKYVRHRPLVDCGLASSPFYDLSGLPLNRIALLLIDGPPGGKRWPGAFLLTKFFEPEFVILADDTDRPQYRLGLELVAHSYCTSNEHREQMLVFHNGWAKLQGKKK